VREKEIHEEFKRAIHKSTCGGSCDDESSDKG